MNDFTPPRFNHWHMARCRQQLTSLMLALACALPLIGAQAQNLLDYGDPQFDSQVRAQLKRMRNTGGKEHFTWIHIGDSHTAGDYLTGALRSGLQQEFGDAGIGWVTPGYVKNQRSDQVKFRNSDLWRVGASNVSAQEGSLGGFPFGGIAGEAQADGAGFALSFKHPRSELMKVTAILKSSPVRSLVKVNGVEIQAESDNGDNSSHLWSIQTAFVDANGSDWDLSVPRAGSALGGLVLDRVASGVRVDAMGINGAQLKTQSLWDQSFFTEYLKWRQPNVVALAYGTNEAFDSHFDALEFENHMALVIRRIREVSSAAIIIIGLPDVAKHNAAPPPKPSRWHLWPKAPSCPPEPVSAPSVRMALQRAAKMNKTLYWDWYSAMGRACSMARLSRLDVPLTRPDMVHFTEEGYKKMGTMLMRDVIER